MDNKLHKMKTSNINEKKDEMESYNLIYIHNFERLHLPKTIIGNLIKRYPEKISIKQFLIFNKIIDNPELSEEVLNTLRESSEDVISIEDVVYKKGIDADTGEVYFDSYTDLTADVIRSMNYPEIKKLLLLLLNSSRRSVTIKDLLSLPGFKPIETQFGKIGLSFYDFVAKNKTLKECKVGLNVVKNGHHHRQDLGILTYSIYRRNPKY